MWADVLGVRQSSKLMHLMLSARLFIADLMERKALAERSEDLLDFEDRLVMTLENKGRDARHPGSGRTGSGPGCHACTPVLTEPIRRRGRGSTQRS